MHIRPSLIRGKMLLQALLVNAVIIAGLCIAQLWWQPMELVIFGKTIATVVLAGLFLSFLLAVDYDLQGHRAKILLASLVVLGAAGTGGVIGQIWWSFLPWNFFVKGIITIFILLVLVAVAMVLREEAGTHRKLKEENYID